MTDENGKYIFVANPTGENINEDPQKLQQLLLRFPRLNNTELLKAKDGIYTWLLFSTTTDNTIRFICTEVVSPFEIGTRHQALAYDSHIEKIYGGGELLKEDKTKLIFNLLSGTYSYPIVRDEINHELSNQIIRAFKVFFPDSIYDRSGISYIKNIKTLLPEVIKIYRDNGYGIILFADYDKCIKFNDIFSNLEFKAEYYKTELAKTTNKLLSIIIKDCYIKSLEKLLEFFVRAV